MTTTASDTATGVSLGGSTTTSDGGSGGNGQSQQATPTTPPATGSQATGGNETPAWYGTLEDQGLKQLAETKGWKSAADALKSYKELETSFSAKQAPARAVPAKADEYKFSIPADIPAEHYSQDFANEFKGWAHKRGLTSDEAAGLHDDFVSFAKSSMASQAEAAQAKLNSDVAAAKAELATKWGQEGTPQFTRNLEMAKRAIRMADPGLMDALKSIGAVADVGGAPVVVNATLFKAFATMGAGMYAEDSLDGNNSAGANPFDDKTEDKAMMGRLMKEDPDKAALLIKAAGKEKMFHQFLERRKQGTRV